MVLVLGCSASLYVNMCVHLLQGKDFPSLGFWLPVDIFKHCNAGIVLLPNPKLNWKKFICKDLQGKTVSLAWSDLVRLRMQWRAVSLLSAPSQFFSVCMNYGRNLKLRTKFGFGGFPDTR